MKKISKTIITDELLQKTMLTFKSFYKEKGKLIENKDFIPNDEVRVLTPNGRFYAPRINLSVELDSSSRASVDDTTTKTNKSQAYDHCQM